MVRSGLGRDYMVVCLGLVVMVGVGVDTVVMGVDVEVDVVDEVVDTLDSAGSVRVVVVVVAPAVHHGVPTTGSELGVRASSRKMKRHLPLTEKEEEKEQVKVKGEDAVLSALVSLYHE